MKNFRIAAAGALALVSALTASAESSYDIAEFYTVAEVKSGTKAVDRHERVVDVEYLLTPTRVDKGKFVVEVKKIGDNLYRVKNSDLCVETRYCHEWTSYSEQVVLIIESNYGYSKGKIIFD